MEFYILVFGVLAVVAVVAFFTIRSSRSARLRRLERDTHAGKGHVREPTRMHPAKQRHEPARHEAGASGGVFRKEGLGAKVKALFKGGPGDDTWGQLEDLLIKADVGPRGSADLVGRVRADFAGGADPVALLRQEIVEVLGPDGSLRLPQGRPGVVMVVGVKIGRAHV